MRMLLAALIIPLAACVPTVERSGPPLPSLAADRSQPMLALADHVLAEYFAQDIASRPTVCIAHHDGSADKPLDASHELALMKRHENLAPMDRCEWGAQGWQDTASDQPALVFTLHSFACETAESCQGWAGYRAGQATSMSYNYRMGWNGERWQFERSAGIVAE